MNKKIIIPVLIILNLTLVFAININTFDNGLSEEKIIFTGNENVSRYLTIPSNANVSNAILSVQTNYTWGNATVIQNPSFEETTDWTVSETDPQFSCSVRSTSNNRFANPDGNYATGFIEFLGALSPSTYCQLQQTVDFTQLDKIRLSVAFNTLSQDVFIGQVYAGGNLVAEIEPEYFDDDKGSNRTIDIDLGNYYGISSLTIRYLYIGLTETNPDTQPFEVDFIQEDVYTPLVNPYLMIDGIEVWNFSGDFAPTDEETFDFTQFLNNAITTCSNQSGDNCIIEFLLHSDNGGELEYYNLSVEYTEPVVPNATINTPTGEYSTTQIPYNISTEENDELETCKYWITRGASLEVANTTVDCNSTIIGTTYVSSQNTAYVFHAWVEDRSGNVNYTNKSFSTSQNATIILPPAGGGGGGGAIVVVDNTESWTFSTAGQTELYELSMSRGTSRDLTLKFTNNGDARTIDLTCVNVEGSACQFVEFDQDEFDLALLKDVEQTVGFTITIPEDTEKARYSFNIIAKDETGRQGNISVLLNVGTGSILTLFFSKLFSTSPFGVPYILLFIFSLAILGFIFSKIFDKSNNKALFTFVFTLLISIGIILVL